METIAYRIWDKENKKFHFSDSTPSMLKSFFEHTAVLHTRDEMPYQQYTGLSDKNKVWIYEGDILGFYYHNPYTRKRYFSKAKSKMKIVSWNTKIRKPEFYEVIGNIYENKGLLKNNI